MKISFIGCGNMGECILSGLVQSGKYPSHAICVFNRTKASVERLCTQYGVSGAASAVAAAASGDVIIIGVKPKGVCEVLESICDAVTEEKIVVSIAAAINIESMEKALKYTPRKVVRVMPNVPTRVQSGVTSITPNLQVSASEVEKICQMFHTIGLVVEVTEQQIHSVIGVAGSSPAYVFLFLEAMADAAVLGGLPRALAYELAAQAVLGSARLLQESGMTPGQLKDMVCSPGGTTIEAVRSLERSGMRSSVIEAMVSCMKKSKELEEALN
uniref:Pyrroline-5-carboxylate reductase n=1 Tax=Trypanosoma congolense (strain IL3000) TaxID=1068625 RepID=G0UPQ6_TRYCI|nr:putative pyrroline-5-carboxylate reductase [Trypanosoma congolense IL3000]